MSNSSAESVESLFVDKHDDLVRFLARRLPNGDDAVDLAQEAYLRLLRRKRQGAIDHPEAYLFRIAANLIYENWIKGKSERALLSTSVDPEFEASKDVSLEFTTANQQSMDALGRVLNALPPLQRKVVLMHRRDGMTYTEISDALDVSRDMVKKYLSKGLSRCRDLLRHYTDD